MVPEAVVGHPCPPSQARQKRVVAAILASASSTSCGTASPSPTKARSRPARPGRARAGPYAIPFDSERQVRPQTNGLACAARVGCQAVTVDQRPIGRRTSVVEHRLADEVDLDLTLDALDRPHQRVVGIVVRGRARVRRDLVLVIPWPHRQRVANDDPSGRRLPRRHEHVRPGLVARADGWLMPKGPNRKNPAWRSSRLAKTLGESKAGTHSQSIDPSGATSAPVWQFERNA